MLHRGALGREERSQVPSASGGPRRLWHGRYVLVDLQSASGACRVYRLRSQDTASGAGWGRESGLPRRGRIRRRAHARHARCCSPAGSVSQGRSIRSLTLGRDKGSRSAPMACTTSGARLSRPKIRVRRARVMPNLRARSAREVTPPHSVCPAAPAPGRWACDAAWRSALALAAARRSRAALRTRTGRRTARLPAPPA